MVVAQDEARRRNQFVEPSHLLLAILRSPNSGAYRLIQRRLRSTHDLATKVLALVHAAPVQGDLVPKKVPMSISAKAAIEQSVEAVTNRDWYWNSCDVLIGIVRDGASPAAEILNSVGVTKVLIDSEIQAYDLSYFFDENKAVAATPQDVHEDFDG